MSQPRSECQFVPLSEIVKTWCKERNSATGANRWLVALWLALLVCLWVSWETKHIGFVFTAIVFTVIWLVSAPKRSAIQRNQIVQDSLLVLLSDAERVPKEVKMAIAVELKKNNQITFETLFEIERWNEIACENERIAQQPGFQKMMAFAPQNDSH